VTKSYDIVNFSFSSLNIFESMFRSIIGDFEKKEILIGTAQSVFSVTVMGASAASPCVRQTASPPQELEY
jgi:hypothetical protein